jgi:hypothetical protein
LKPGKFEKHISFTEPEEESYRWTGLNIPLPNGLYKYSLHFETNEDPNALNFEWISETKVRMRDETI